MSGEPLICENRRCLKSLYGQVFTVTRKTKPEAISCTNLFIACSWSCVQVIAEEDGLAELT